MTEKCWTLNVLTLHVNEHHEGLTVLRALRFPY